MNHRPSLKTVPKLTDEEKGWWYGLWHVHEGAMWFSADDLQITARMNQFGLVWLNPDYEGFYIVPHEKAKPLKKRSEKCFDL